MTSVKACDAECTLPRELDGVTGRLPGAVKVVIPQHSDVADRVGPNVQPSTIEG
jgi:hypothetical protein